eukprot:11533394-Ditylum_brightwellii.AAC.1
MKHSEELGYLADEQHGGREGRTSVNVVALKQFTTETHHYQKSNAGITDYNTKACYNRIMPELLALLYAKARYPTQVVDLLYSALIKLEYYMTMAFGESENNSTSKINHLLFGIGQGATDGPSGWTYHTNMITMLYNKRAGRSIMKNLTGEIT